MAEAGLARCLRTADKLLSTSVPTEECDQQTVTDLVEQHRGCIREIEQHALDLAGPTPTTAAAAAGAPLGTGHEDVASCADVDPQEWQVPPHCVPIHANVTTYPWSRLYQHTQFDVIMMDPPWQLATSNPTRGVALGYSQLTDADIRALPIPQLQSNGLLFMWVINAKFRFTLELFEQWGYRWVYWHSSHALIRSHALMRSKAQLHAHSGKIPPLIESAIPASLAPYCCAQCALLTTLSAMHTCASVAALLLPQARG